MSRTPVPVEKKKRLGNPGKRPIPDAEILLAPAQGPRRSADPLFPLGIRGRTVWDHLLAFAGDWIGDTDLPMLQRLCELEDDAAALRYSILEAPHRHGAWRDRAQHLAIAKELRHLYGEFGLTPAERSRLGIAQVHAAADLTRAHAAASRGKTYGEPPPPVPATASAPRRRRSAPAPTKTEPAPNRQMSLGMSTEPAR